MIKKVLHNNLKKCFLKIGFKENKGSDLAVNEWNYLNANTSVMQNFNEVSISVEALFERNDYDKKILNKNEFINNLKQFFVVENIETIKTAKKRLKIIFTLKQATCEV
jgi:hypothetical protein